MIVWNMDFCYFVNGTSCTREHAAFILMAYYGGDAESLIETCEFSLAEAHETTGQMMYVDNACGVALSIKS